MRLLGERLTPLLVDNTKLAAATKRDYLQRPKRCGQLGTPSRPRRLRRRHRVARTLQPVTGWRFCRSRSRLGSVCWGASTASGINLRCCFLRSLLRDGTADWALQSSRPYFQVWLTTTLLRSRFTRLDSRNTTFSTSGCTSRSPFSSLGFVRFAGGQNVSCVPASKSIAG